MTVQRVSRENRSWIEVVAILVAAVAASPVVFILLFAIVFELSAGERVWPLAIGLPLLALVGAGVAFVVSLSRDIARRVARRRPPN